MNWYYSVEGHALGPVNEEALEKLAREGALVKDTLVWQPELEEWAPLQKVHPDLLERVRLVQEKPAPLTKATAPLPLPPPPSHAASNGGAPGDSHKEKPGLFGRLFGRERN
ncbi:DUF4339 domain-containing protein [Verrucomicrobium sp. BvORR106]|uniref:DUF4339 domain-containing protein n=1 Tax=Verrucomicrobium sp. BvORR106 TaxID=1403819 RepID=UPI00056E38F6|nr:DUF4339 domain-containing protein [Verrucomicrobium sp. BvORR106]